MGARGGGGGRGGRGGGGGRTGYESMSRNEIAKILSNAGYMSRWNNNSNWDYYYDSSWRMLRAASTKTDTFGGKIAKDILDRTTEAEKKYRKMLTPRVSPKQAWAIANTLSSK